MKSIMFLLLTLTVTILVVFPCTVLLRAVDPTLDPRDFPPLVSALSFIVIWAAVALSIRDIDNEIRQ